MVHDIEDRSTMKGPQENIILTVASKKLKLPAIMLCHAALHLLCVNLKYLVTVKPQNCGSTNGRFLKLGQHKCFSEYELVRLFILY